MLVLAGELFGGIVEKADAAVVTEPDTELEAIDDESSHLTLLDISDGATTGHNIRLYCHLSGLKVFIHRVKPVYNKNSIFSLL